MPINVAGTAQIRHVDTGKVFTIEPDELEWETDDGDERQMGLELTHTAVVHHPELGQLTWHVWEYPVGVENDREVDVGRHGLLRNFGLGLTPDPDDRAERVEAMIAWFHERYEDPAERTPYESAEGGYQWIWGGPYDARDVLGSAFPNEDQDLIEQAIEDIQSEGIFDWAPAPQQGDYDEEPEHLTPEPSGVVDETEAVPEADEDLAAVLSERRAGAIFGIDAEGRIELVSWAESPPPQGAQLLDEMRDACSNVIDLLAGSNAHQDLLQATARYQVALPEGPLSIQRLYARGIALENVLFQVDNQIRSDERPPLPGGARPSLETLTQLHASFIMANPEGRDLADNAVRYRRQPEAQRVLSETVSKLAQAIINDTTLFSASVREAVAEVADQTGSGLRPDRSNQVAEHFIGSLLRFVGTIAVGGASWGAMTIVGDGLASAPVGQALMHSVTTVATLAPQFLAANGALLTAFAAQTVPELGWMSSLLARLMHRR